MEIPGVAPFAGMVVLLAFPVLKRHSTPAVEIGWRLAAEHWGQLHATEG